MKRMNVLITSLAISLALAVGASAQTTEFSYQGFLNDNNASANGNFDFEFRLFNAATGSTPLGSLQRPNVTVTNGVFSVVLDFGVFPPAQRFLEIGVRPAGGAAFTTLAPRSKILSTPYATSAMSAQNALQLGGTSANQFVQTNDGRLSDARDPLPNSPNYIQNSTAPQTNGNFNIAGNGTAGGTLAGNVVKATTQFNIGGDRVLSNAGTGNIFAGKDAGAVNSGLFNSFVGAAAGLSNTTGFANSFFGSTAGGENTTGNSNSFFGLGAGNSNLTGSANSFYGVNAGASNTASSNSFFGASAGQSNTIGNENAFFGFEAGKLNVIGSRNSIFGDEAGESNVSGSSNSYFGREAGKLGTGGSNTYIGASAGADTTTGARNTFVGAEAGLVNLSGTGNSFFGKGAGIGNVDGLDNTAIGVNSDLFPGLTNATVVGANALVEQSNSVVLGSISGLNGATTTVKVGIGTTTPDDRLHVDGIIRVDQLGPSSIEGRWLCWNPSHQIAECPTIIIGSLGKEAEKDGAADDLLKDVKQLRAQIEQQKKQISAQQMRSDSQQAEITRLAQVLRQLSNQTTNRRAKGGDK